MEKEVRAKVSLLGHYQLESDSVAFTARFQPFLQSVGIGLRA